MSIDGQIEDLNIANLFADSFGTVGISPVHNARTYFGLALHESLKSYKGASFNYDTFISIKVIDKLVNVFSWAKAAGFDLLTAEHLKFSHPVVILLLELLFSLMMSVDYVPDAFSCGITVPLPKVSAKGTANKSDDYRGINILPIISKLFELKLQKCLEPFLKGSTA